MTAMNMRVTCEAAFGFGPFATLTEANWVELTESGQPRLRTADWTVGRSNELEHFEAGTASVLLSNRDRALDPDNPASVYVGQLLPYVPVRLRSIGPAPALDLPGGSATATTPDHASFAITDLDITIRLSMDDWTPGSTQILIGQNGLLADVGWSIQVLSTGRLQLLWSPDGSTATQITRDTTNPLGFNDGSDHKLRVTMDVNDGAGNRVITFYVDDVLLETFTTAGTTTIFNSTQALTIGLLSLAGNVRNAQLLTGIGGTAVANPDFMAQPPGTTSFVDAAGRTWTVNSPATIANDPNTRFDEFYGFVQGGWEQQVGTNMSDCRLELVDLLGIMAGYTLPDMFIYQLQQTAGLVGIWDMTETPEVEESVPDVSGHSHDGRVMGSVTFGERGTQPGHSSSALFEAVSSAFPDRDQSYIDLGRSQLLASTFSTSSVVATFKRRSAATLNFGVLFAHGNGQSSAMSGVSLKVKPAGNIEYIYLSAGAGVNFQHPTPVGADQHCVIATGAGIGLDTATLNATSTGGSMSHVNGAYIGGGRGVNLADHWDGWIGVIAIFDDNLGATDRQLVMNACQKLQGVTSDVQLSWALDRLGVPASKRNLDTGTVIMGPAETKGSDALEWMREVVATEGGSLYIDHRDRGKVRFTNRYARYLSTRSSISQATFSDQPSTPTAIRYPAEGLEVAPNGIDGIINQVPVTWRDGEVLVENSTSIAAYGPRSRTLDTQATTANQARSAGEWIVARYKDPRSRIRGCVSSARSTRQRDSRVHGLRIDDRVTFKIQPLHTGTVTSTDLYVDGVSHSAHGVEWVTSFRFAPANTFSPWVWGTSAWGTTAYWG